MSNNRPRQLASILHYGYDLHAPGQPLALPFATDALVGVPDERQTLRALSEAALCKHGIRLWKQLCRRVAESRDGRFVLPLSSGLDSRAVLAGMVAQGGVDITTMTYGVPGALDYEIAPAVAAAVGVPNTRLNLHEVRVDSERIDRIALEPGRMSTFLDMYFNRQVSDRLGPDCTYLSGYLGDVLAGKNLRREISGSWDRARRVFAAANRRSRTAWLAPPDVDPEALLPACPFVDEALLDHDEQLDYAVRQECMMRPIVMRRDYDSIAPMLEPEWVHFMLALDRYHRLDRRLFKKMFATGFPELFRLPTSANGGLPLQAPAPRVARYRRSLRHRRRWRLRLQKLLPSVGVPLGNPAWQYIDLRRALSERPDVSMLLERSLAEVQARELLPWLDVTQILREYRQGELGHSRALLVLLDLGVLSRATGRESSVRLRDTG